MARQGQILACLEAEQAVLGALLIDHSAIYEVQAILQPDDFANEGHRRTYCAMLALLQQNKKFDYVSLHDELTRTSQLDMVGDGGNRGAAYLTWLINAVPTSAHAAHYAQIVHDYAMRRALMQAAGQIAKLAHDEQNATEAITK